MSISAFSSVARHRKSEMNCDDCEQGIEGTYFEVNGGKPVCAKCYEVRTYYYGLICKSVIYDYFSSYKYNRFL